METAAYSGTSAAGRADRGRWLYFGAGCAIGFLSAVCLGVAAAITGLGSLVSWGAAPQGLSVSYEMPSRASLNDEFDLVLTLTNNRDSDLTVGDIDLRRLFADSILDGVTVLSTDPGMQVDSDSTVGVVTYLYHQTIPSGESREVVFHLRATTVGRFTGPIDVYEGMKSVTIDGLTITITG